MSMAKSFGPLNLRQREGVEIVKKMIANHDVLTENFRPGILTKWRLDSEIPWQTSPNLVIVASNVKNVKQIWLVAKSGFEARYLVR